MCQKNKDLDLFICHASEDKDLIARPLKKYFDENGLNAWYDEDSILFSDSISNKIYKGIKNSKGAIIILSENFYKKEWALLEFGGIIYKWFSDEGVLYLLYWDVDIKNVNEKLSFIGNIRGLKMIDYANINDVAKDICKDYNFKKKKIEEKRTTLLRKLKKIGLIIGTLSIILLFVYLNGFEIFTTQKTENVQIAKEKHNNRIYKIPVMQTKTGNNNTIKKGPYGFSGDNNTISESSILNIKNKSEFSVIIIDEDKNIENSVSNAIVELYKDTGKEVSTGLIRNSFVKTYDFEELFQGNSSVIEKISLYKYTDNLILGKIHFTFKKGQIIQDTYLCNAILTISIITMKDRAIKNFEVIGKWNGVSESQAKEGALNNLLSNLKEQISLIK